MKRKMATGLRLNQMRAFMKIGRWQWAVRCWAHHGRWVLSVSPRGDREVPYHYLKAEKSGQPRLLKSETALVIAQQLSDEGVYFDRRSFESVTAPKPWQSVENLSLGQDVHQS